MAISDAERISVDEGKEHMAKNTPAPKPKGRPSAYTQAVADEICERLSKGEPLAQICRDEHMPAVRTVSDWKDAHETFAADFARAREEGYDEIALDTLNIIDTIPERHATKEGDKVDPGHVAWLKNRAEQRLKLLAKWDPKRYGDKLAIGGASDLPPMETTATLNVAGLSTEVLDAIMQARDAAQ
jgi:hypothetical protein